ncbi:MAG TPA: cysteine--tRNA ligase [Pirellulaceae bacterium]|nr:cysteine--tRNA ligase [Pirellulaceae bacterium]
MPTSTRRTRTRSKATPMPTAPIQVYDTLTRSKRPLKTVEPGKVGIYLCGPTVYKEAHIGHMVGPVIFDTVARYLRFCGYEVNWVVNITDVDDKLIAESQRRGIPMSQVATQMTADYCANLLEVGVDQITHMPRATENIDEIIAFIEELIAKDHAYAVDGDVFFDVARDAEYGKLTNRRPEDQQGEGGKAATKKRNAGDFALWKGAKPGEPSWDSPWGEGRPGWHIECSAMSRRILGKTFDIHGGGLDLTFPHHENEIAQSECCHGAPMANYWMHNGLMRASAAAGKVGGRTDREGADAGAEEQATVDTKISRSKGGGGLRALLAQQGGERIRFFLLRTHYRSTAVFGDDTLAEAGAALDKFYTFFERYRRVFGRSFYLDPAGDDRASVIVREPGSTARDAGEIATNDDPLLIETAKLRTAFLSKMDDDFNTGGATADLFLLLNLLNRTVEQQGLEEGKGTEAQRAALARACETLRELGAILGLFVKPPKQASGSGDGEVLGKVIDLLIRMRNDARKAKDFATSDRIRNELLEIGVTLEDRKEGTGWRVG